MPGALSRATAADAHLRAAVRGASALLHRIWHIAVRPQTTRGAAGARRHDTTGKPRRRNRRFLGAPSPGPRVACDAIVAITCKHVRVGLESRAPASITPRHYARCGTCGRGPIALSLDVSGAIRPHPARAWTCAVATATAARRCLPRVAAAAWGGISCGAFDALRMEPLDNRVPAAPPICVICGFAPAAAAADAAATAAAAASRTERERKVHVKHLQVVKALRVGTGTSEEEEPLAVRREAHACPRRGCPSSRIQPIPPQSLHMQDVDIVQAAASVPATEDKEMVPVDRGRVVRAACWSITAHKWVRPNHRSNVEYVNVIQILVPVAAAEHHDPTTRHEVRSVHVAWARRLTVWELQSLPRERLDVKPVHVARGERTAPKPAADDVDVSALECCCVPVSPRREVACTLLVHIPRLALAVENVQRAVILRPIIAAEEKYPPVSNVRSCVVLDFRSAAVRDHRSPSISSHC